MGVQDDLGGLSSNWKKLQKTLLKVVEKKSHSRLRQDARVTGKPTPTDDLKRKSRDKDADKSENSRKRQKTERSSDVQTQVRDFRKRLPQKQNGMGAVHSAISTPSTPAPSLSSIQSVKPAAGSHSATASSSLPVLPTSGAPNAKTEIPNQGLSSSAQIGKFVALDCEMVGVGPPPATDSMLARVSLVNYHGEQIYDSYVLPVMLVTDYRTFVTGITAHELRPGHARPFTQVQAEISSLLTGRTLIGHALKHDFAALLLSHPKRDIRDTARHPAYRALAKGRTPSLKRLSMEVLGVGIQDGMHSSVEDARAAMMLFRRERDAFEREWRAKWGRGGGNVGGGRVNGRGKGSGGGTEANSDVEEDEDEEKEEDVDGEDGGGDLVVVADGLIQDARPRSNQQRKKKKKKRTKR